jgi:ABC-type branched-subunit amino acid transport system substrate-binding protein
MNGILRLVALLLVLLITPVCRANGAECKDRICVGVVLPLSVYGEFGTAIMNGIALAEEDTPGLSASIPFRVEDSAFSTVRAVSALNKLAKVDRVKVAYVLGGPLSDAVAPLADRLGVVTLVSSNEPALAIRHRHVIRFANPASDFGIALYKELVARQLFRVGLVMTENPYMDSIVAALKSAADGRFVFHELHRAGGDSMDFRSVVTRLKQGGFDVLGVMVHPGQISRLYRQLAEQRVMIQSFGVDALESASEIEDSGPSIKGAFFVNHQVSSDFHQRYLRKYGNETLIAFASWGYDLAVILRQALREIPPSASSAEILRALKQDRIYDGSSGKVRFMSTEEGDSHFSFPLVVKTVR